MAKRGRPKGSKNLTGKGFTYADGCFFCEGTKYHWGEPCKACDATGSEKVRKQLTKVYNAKNKLPIATSIFIKKRA